MQSSNQTSAKEGGSAMIDTNENPVICANITTGSNDCHSQKGCIKHISTKTICKAKKAFELTDGRVLHLFENTRLCDVATKLIETGQSGISVADFSTGVRLSALVHQLRGLGLAISTTRKLDRCDPFKAHRAVYRLTQLN
jgi:hypothetical protein